MRIIIILTSQIKKLRLKGGSGFRVSAASLPRKGWLNSGKLSLFRAQFSLLYNRNGPTSRCFLKSSPLFTTPRVTVTRCVMMSCVMGQASGDRRLPERGSLEGAGFHSSKRPLSPNYEAVSTSHQHAQREGQLKDYAGSGLWCLSSRTLACLPSGKVKECVPE